MNKIKKWFKLITYKIKLVSRLRYFYCINTKSEYETFKDYIKFTIYKYREGYKIYNELIKKNKIELVNYQDYRKLDYLLISELMKKGLYLYPSYVFYPNSAEIILTYECNYRCNHCYQPNYKKRSLSIKKIILFSEKLKEVGITKIFLSGGELFLNIKKLTKIISVLKKKGIFVYGIATNGFWLKDEKTAFKYLNLLKRSGFSGEIVVSIGIGHQSQNKKIDCFFNIDALSKRVFDKNIFFFSFEDTSYESFKKKKKEFKPFFEKFNVNYNRIIPIGNATLYKEKIYEENKDSPEIPNNLYCTCFKLLPDETISFCAGPNAEKEFTLSKLTRSLSLKEFILKENKHLIILSRFKGYELLNILIKNKKIKKNEFSFMCQLCIHLAKNPELIDFIYKTKVK